MHEMSLAESVLQIIEDNAARQGFRRVSAVYVEVGRLAGVEVEALRFAFDAVTRDSVADGARLEIIDVPGQGWCLNCSETVPIDQLYDACPRCGAYQVHPSQGIDMRVKELAVE
ncbi:MAG TPA: hydrogenase maturation nickel metallochaperone HypA [Rhodocyclaceae bacterium]|jgi:hydrogenase nickel incorporation protein HypA/HybF|nr:hydrogenase maturation nickel metallochaperone HypA [Rhodocyclaceae bacterium]